MLTVRSFLGNVTNEVFDNQENVESVVLFGRTPTTSLEKKAAAIVWHPDIHPVLRCKAAENIRLIVESFLTFVVHKDGDTFEVQSSNREAEKCVMMYLQRLPETTLRQQPDEFQVAVVDVLNNDPTVKLRVKDFLNNLKLTISSTVVIPSNLPIYVMGSNANRIDLDRNFETKISSYANIPDFEFLVFENNTILKYTGNASFATYLYTNLLHYLNVDNINELRERNDWRSRLAILLHDTKFDCNVAKIAFYEYEIEYNGSLYTLPDTTPRYNVLSLKPQTYINFAANDQSLIDYYYNLDVKNTSTVQIDKIGIFLVFPFKDGCYIQPDGEIVNLNLNICRKNSSTRLLIENLCNVYDIEEALNNAARLISAKEALQFAVDSNVLDTQAMALLILRRKYGEALYVQSYRIELPSEMTALSWTKRFCKKYEIQLPYAYDLPTNNLYLSMIHDITESSYTKMGAAVLCSSYSVPEINYGGVYLKLRNDGEKYVFYTLMLQDYPIPLINNARKFLNPEFGKSPRDLTKYPVCKREYSNTTVNDRLNAISEYVLNDGSPYTNKNSYEFVDSQLQELVATGDVQLTDEQLANFIALCVV